MTEANKTVEDKLIVFLDAVGRTIIGKRTGENDNYLKVENPVVVHVVPQQDPQSGVARMTLQLFPLFFREFLADQDQAIVWDYLKSNIILTENEVVFDFKLKAQYEQLFQPVANFPQAGQPANPAGPVPAGPGPAPTNNIVPLFDETK